jgi:hypothetical protein
MLGVAKVLGIDREFVALHKSNYIVPVCGDKNATFVVSLNARQRLATFGVSTRLSALGMEWNGMVP